MIARYQETAIDESSPVRHAFEVFLASQQGSGMPRTIFRQTVHAKLAGELAQRLRPEIFGAVTPEVLEAIAQHDWGWAESDAQQLELLPEQDPRPFPQLREGEELPAWERSLQFADGRPLLTRVLIRRHFCALANRAGQLHAEFRERERSKTESLERELGIDSAQLKRGTDALGFCDLVSLYLCSGATAPAEFPLAHPAEPYAADAKKVVARWRGETLEFSEAVFVEDTRVRAEMLRVEDGRVSSEKVEWRIA